MEKLEITTSHNIVVRVELASVSQRALATFLDLIFIGIYASIVSLVFGGLQSIANLLIIPVILCYHLIFEYFNDGRSIGKKLLKLRVVSLDGGRPTLLALTTRWMFRLIDVTLSLGILGSILVSTSRKNQRIGDTLANTTVVREENEDFISLDMLKNIVAEGYTITYPGVTRYSDQDMILVKETLSRYEAKNNQHNLSILTDLHKKITTDLGIKSNSRLSKKEVLKKVLSDYVVMTR